MPASKDDAERPSDDSDTSLDTSTRRLERRDLLRTVGTAALGTILGTAYGSDNVRAHDRTYTDADEQSGTPVSVKELVDQMTLTEKVNKLHMHPGPAPDVPIGYIAPTDRLEIPSLQFADGPAGVRHPQGADPRGARSSDSAFNAFVMVLSGGPSTAFPAPVSQISTWDEDRLDDFGTALGLEAKAKDIGCMFAPAFNIVRVPEGGRTFEYYGEDPYLAGRGAVKAIDGIQSTGTVATAKLYVANNHETNRVTVSADVSERTLPRNLHAGVPRGRRGGRGRIGDGRVQQS